MTIRETRIGVFLNGHRAALCYTVLLEIMLLFPMIMSPIFKRVFTDSILINNITGRLPVLLLLMTGAAFFSALISVVFYYYMMFRMDFSMSLIVLALVTANLLVGKIQSALVRAFSRSPPEPLSLRDLTLRDERISSQGLRGIETLKATASETHFFQQIMSSKIRIINAKGKDDEAEASRPFDNLPEIFFLNILLLISALPIGI